MVKQYGARVRRACGTGLLGVAIAVSAAACGGESSSAAPQRPVPTPTPSSVTSLHLPLDAYTLNTSQTASGEYLRLALQRSCMAKLGFSDYPPGLTSGYVTQDARVFQEFNSRLWGISDPVQAALYGYHLPPWTHASVTGKVLTIGDLPAAEQTALLGRGKAASGGIPAGGCTGQADREESAAGLSVGGHPPALVSQLQQESFDQAKSDARVVKVFASWSACMRMSGFNYPDPFSVNFDMSAPVSSLEKETAKTDIACKRKTNLLGVTYAVLSDYQNKLIEQNAQELAQVQQQVRREQDALVSVMRKYGVS